ncbi:MAG: hypothetical protein WCG85_27745 [Polyangia bacterium]
MRKIVMAAVLTSTVLLPAISKADWLVEASLGEGYQVTTPRDWERLNLMVTPSYALPLPVLSWVRLQLGVVADLGVAGQPGNKATNLELRPMIAIVPPLIPLYGRAIFAVTNLIERNGEKREIAYGAALGMSFGLGPIGVFGEVGVLPGKRHFPGETVDAPTMDSKFAWVVEARAGAYYKF